MKKFSKYFIYLAYLILAAVMITVDVTRFPEMMNITFEDVPVWASVIGAAAVVLLDVTPIVLGCHIELNKK